MAEGLADRVLTSYFAVQEGVDSLLIVLVDEPRPGTTRIHYFGDGHRPEDNM